jgi:peptidyl-tRNA hydrolase, PTH2 family
LAIKQIIVVNEALQLPRGKLAAQVAHAAVAAFLESSKEIQRRWLEEGMPKVVLRCDSAEALLALHAQAESANVPVADIRDAGHTVVAADTLTCVGIGPASADLIDSITGGLKLVR